MRERHFNYRPVAGPALFDESGCLRIGQGGLHRPGDWVKVTIYAPGPESLVRKLADQKRGVDPRTTDIFYVVELQGDGEETLRVRRQGTPTWMGENLDLVVWHGISVMYSTGGSGSEGAIGVIVAGDPLE